jgi:hypothetical protein
MLTMKKVSGIHSAGQVKEITGTDKGELDKMDSTG